MPEIFDYIVTHYAQWLYLLATLSFVFFVLSLLLIPYLVTRIPTDYFVEAKRVPTVQSFSRSAFLRSLARNLVGTLLVLAGITMLLLPGQGILTILVGLFVADFPGKYQLERQIVCKPAILKSLNWIRRRQNIPALRVN